WFSCTCRMVVHQKVSTYIDFQKSPSTDGVEPAGAGKSECFIGKRAIVAFGAVTANFAFIRQLLLISNFPLKPYLRIRNHRKEDAPYNRPRLKSLLSPISRPVPIRQWYSAWGRPDKSLEGENHAVKFLAVIGERGRPDFPIQFGVVASVIERQTKLIQVSLVKLRFRSGNAHREYVQVENSIPDEIVFLTPCSGLIKGEAEMVTIPRQLDPLLRHGSAQVAIFEGLGLPIRLVCQSCETCQRQDRFDRQIRVMCEVPREIVRGKLIGRIHPLVSKVFRPPL